jgi:hypothetical protein
MRKRKAARPFRGRRRPEFPLDAELEFALCWPVGSPVNFESPEIQRQLRCFADAWRLPIGVVAEHLRERR